MIDLGSLKNLTETVNGHLRFVSKPTLVRSIRELDAPKRAVDDLQTWMTRLLSEYADTLCRDRRHLVRQYTFVDIARKVVGVGSVGTRAWIVLLRGGRTGRLVTGRSPMTSTR